MKNGKQKDSGANPRRGRRATLPEFSATRDDARFPLNLNLAKYGQQIGERLAAVELVEVISRWQSRVVKDGKSLESAGFSQQQIAEFHRNADARVSWSRIIEKAIQGNDAQFFETIAAILKFRSEESQAMHPVEYHTWKECFRLLWATERPHPNGKGTVADWPTKLEIQRAVEAKGYSVPRWARVFKRLHLEWLPQAKRGKKR